MSTISLREFIALPAPQKRQLVYQKASFLMIIKHDSVVYRLYAFYNFYIEYAYDIETNEVWISAFQGSIKSRKLQKYLDEVELSGV